MGTSLSRMTLRMKPTETIRVYGSDLPEEEQLPEEDQLIIEADARQLTAGDIASISSAFETEDLGRGAQAIAELLVRAVRSWSLVDDNGEPVPVTVKAAMDLPMWALMEAWVGIRGDAAGEAKNGSSI